LFLSGDQRLLEVEIAVLIVKVSITREVLDERQLAKAVKYPFHFFLSFRDISY